ncbi:MAG TPA: DUF4124 domain-containing protein [Noviherbaspirillum sp.]|nr:DUF4124 domain-containing protein [Noviherbaspirillum sp.]
MKSFHFRHLAATAAALMGLALAGTAFAQYVWVDEKGVKQYSDMPPPASVPANRILKQRGVAVSQQPEAETAAAPKTDLSTAEKEAEFRKRRAEQAEKDKKAAEQAKYAADKAKHCERAREYNRALESGQRIARTDKDGERTFLTDEQRAQELRDSRRTLEDCK